MMRLTRQIVQYEKLNEPSKIAAYQSKGNKKRRTRNDAKINIKMDSFKDHDNLK
jgi:hypothetical protein